MGTKHKLLAAVAPLALGSLIVMPADAAEIKRRVPSIDSVPKIDPRVPAKTDEISRIRNVVISSQDDEVAARKSREEAQSDDETAEARPDSSKPVRNRIPVIKTDRSAEVEDTPHIRTRIPPTRSDDAVATQSAEASPSTSPVRVRPSRIDVSVPAEIKELPPSRKRLPVREADDADQNDASPTTPVRIRTPKQVEERIEEMEESGPKTRQSTPPAGRPPIRYLERRADEPVSRFETVAKPGSVILKGENEKEVLGGLKIIRTIDLAALSKNPKLDIGSTTFDFSPILKNPKSLPNIAKQLEAMPDLVQVHKGKLTASQIGQGVVLTSTLSYSLKQKACTSAENRARILATGVSCFSYRAPSSREAAVAKTGSVEFVERTVDRNKAISTMRDQAKTVGTDIDQSVAEFRAMLQDPGQRAELEANLGSAEVQRMEQLDDTALAGELVNNQDVEITEYGFVPILQPIQPTADWETIKAARAAFEKRLAAADTQLAPATQPVTYAIPEYNFLTGFTLSDSPEWRKRVSTTIRWCVVGCKKTYFAEAWAGFDYGIGLRFPMRFGGNYTFDPSGKATLQPSVKMFDGSVDDYRSTGLPSEQLFNGQELVAQFGAHAGVAAKLPLVGGIGPFELSPKLVLTDYLGGSFKGGQVTPPFPGQANPPSDNFVLEQVDLLNNNANFGFIAAKIHPSVNITLSSNDMGVAIQGQVLSFNTNPNPTIALPIDAAQISSFTVSKPKYDIRVTLKPGVTARMSLNLAVWSASVDWPVELPIAGMKIDAGFGCHEGTICERDYVLSPDGPYSAFKRDVKNWGLAYDKQWLPKCLDQTCTTSIKLKRYDTVEWAWDQEDILGQNASTKAPPVSDRLAEAHKAAEKYYADSIARKAQKSSDTSEAMGALAMAIYTPQCKDSLCVDNIAKLAAQMGPVAKDATHLDPTMDAATVNKMVNKEFGPKFVAEVQASEQRAQMKQAASVMEQAKKTGKQPKLPK